MKGVLPMTIAVRYYTKSGNTAKLANAIADALGVPAETIDKPLNAKVDILFLGCSYYAFDMDPQVKAFLAANQSNIGTLVCFGTSAMMKSMKKPLQKVLSNTSIHLSDAEFHCRGEFHFANKGRPNADDLQAAAAFAKSIVK